MSEQGGQQDRSLVLPKVNIFGFDISKILMLGVVILAMPLAPELLLFMEFAGIEVAFTCFLIMVKPLSIWFHDKKEKTKVIWLTIRQCTREKPFNQLCIALYVSCLISLFI